MKAAQFGIKKDMSPQTVRVFKGRQKSKGERGRGEGKQTGLLAPRCELVPPDSATGDVSLREIPPGFLRDFQRVGKEKVFFWAFAEARTI